MASRKNRNMQNVATNYTNKRDATKVSRTRYLGQIDAVNDPYNGLRRQTINGKTYVVYTNNGRSVVTQGPKRKTISKQSVSVTPAQERYLQQQRRNRQNTGRNEADGLGRFLGKVSSTIRGTDNSKPAPTPTSNGNKTLASINKANTIRKQKLVAAANARRKAQQETAKEKEKSSASTTQVVATSGGAAVTPKSSRSSGGRTTGGRTPSRRRKYLDSTPTVSRNRRQRAVASVAPRMSREDVAYGRLTDREREIVSTVPEATLGIIESLPTARTAAQQIINSEDYDDLYKLRQQYKRGGKVRC